MGLAAAAAAVAGVLAASGQPQKSAAPRPRPSGTPVRKRLPPAKKPKPPPPPPAVKSVMAPWGQPLPVPIAQALAFPGPPGKILVVGGQTSSGASGSGAFLVDMATGSLRLAADLVAGVHEAAGAALGPADLVFGGRGPSAASAVTSTVQSFPAPAAAGTRAGPSRTPSTRPAGRPAVTAPTSTAGVQAARATAIGALPEPRAGAGAVRIGATAYIVGGYEGTRPEGAVLATSDGVTFSTVARLAVAVRDPAVGVAGGEIYVFGGSVPGAQPGKAPAPWRPVAYIQEVNPVTGRASVVGRLPSAVAGAVAVNLGGHVYVAGGQGPTGVNGAIWGFEAATGRMVVSGHLKVPVAAAAAATVGTKAWLVGGRGRGGRLVGTVQAFQPVSPAA